jgi:hypothetical protein
MPSRTGELLRGAVETGNYREMERLLEVYRSEVEVCWKATSSAVERQQMAKEVTALLAWARQTILAKRAHAQQKLIHLTRQSAYVNASAPQFD